ncbi:uncharacterized protein LOC113532664 isoform X1 [Pangasianodon hypophthalmus]|uniref:uncharacterized protein LOC113532664 isoform X1 n=2 Tax=Pangasianodon hypophthalmus TaxID=310915 RepID=UPI002307BFA8|nr:uncharacterized protein LOC113532664 isoform X1 [Pangasianodon hypophthalmus]XP_053084019.1 uncharacterized protein LOC113532664 isoform X1 [Pangasianodon hypophthalmus]
MCYSFVSTALALLLFITCCFHSFELNRTMRFFQLWVTLWLFTLKDLHMATSITVKFPNKEPLYIALGRTLVLEAQFQLQEGERVILQTWERKNSDGEVRVAEGGRSKQNRTFVEKNGALLRINGVKDSDYGIYKVTFTAASGDQVSDSRQVLKITNPPKAYLSMQCSIPRKGAQWDSPVFSWQVDGVDMTNQTGEISVDGSTLLLKNLSRSYTCTTDSSQGTSKVAVHLKEPDPSPNSCSCTGWIVAVVLLIIIVIGLIGVLCYKTRTSARPDHKERDTL